MSRKVKSAALPDMERASSGEDGDMPRLFVDEVEERIISDALARPFIHADAPARVVTCGSRPYAMLRANSAFHSLTGLAPETSYGSSLKVLHTESTNSQVWEACMGAASKSADTEACILSFQLAGGSSEVVRMEVTPIVAGKDVERRLFLVEVSKAPTFRSVESVQANSSRGARAIVRLINPQHITHVSDGWCSAFEADRKQCVGRSLKGLNGPATDPRIVQRMMKSVSLCLPAEETFVAYCLNGTMKLVNLRCEPLQRSSGDVDHFCVDAVSTPIQMLSAELTKPTDDPALVLAADSSRAVLHASPAFCTMLSLAPEAVTPGTVLTKFLNAALDGPVLDSAVSDAVQCLAGRKRAAPLLLTFFNQDNKPVVAKAQLTPLLDASFALSHVKLTLAQVDVLSFAAAVAPSAEASLPKIITTISPEALVKHASPEWCALYGYEQNQVEGASLQALHDTSAEPEKMQEMMDKVSAGKTHEFRMSTHRRDGTTLVATLRATPVLSDTGRLDLCMAEVLEANEVEEAPASADNNPPAKLPTAGESASAGEESAEYPITPTGHITHMNGYTQLVLYPKADPTLELCLDYLEHLRDAAIVKGWRWDGDALRVNVDTRRVLNSTHQSPWCRTWTPNLRTWDAWWNRMLWVVGEASRRQDAKHDADLASDLDFLGGNPHAMPAPDELYAAAAFRPLSEGSTSPSNDDTDDDDACSAEPEPRACHSAPPARPEPVTEIALQRLRASPAYAAVSRLGARLGEAGVESPVCVLDGKGSLVLVNDMLVGLTGFTERQTLGLNWSLLAAPDADPAAVSLLHAALDRAVPNKDVQGSVLMRRSDGSTFWASMLARPVVVAIGGEETLCWCASVEDESFIVEAEDDGGAEVDTYVAVAKEELAWEQRDALAVMHQLLLLAPDDHIKEEENEDEEDAPCVVHVKVEPGEVRVEEEEKEEQEDEVEALRAQVAALQLQLTQQNASQNTTSLQAQLETERAVNAAALSALGNSLPRVKKEEAPAPPQLSQLAGGAEERDAAFGAMSEESRRQYLRQVEAAHVFLSEQLQLETASVWTAELVAAFDAEMKRGAELQSGLCLCDDLGGLVWSNAAFLEVTGFEARDALGCQWMSVLCGPESDADDVAGLQRGLDARTPASACLLGLHEDGSPLWLQVRQQPAQLPRGPGCVLLALDDVTPLMRRILGGDPRFQGDSALALRAAEVISQRQLLASNVAASALAALGAPAHPTAAPPSRPANTKPSQASPRANLKSSLGSGTGSPNVIAGREVLLLPEADSAEVMLSGVLWRLRDRGLVLRWAWEGDLSLRLWLAGRWAVEGALSGPWRWWWRRMQEAAAPADPLSVREAMLEGPEARAVCAARDPWVILEINPALQRLTGFCNADVKGRSLCMLQGMLDWPAVARAMHGAQHVIKTGDGPGLPPAVPVTASRKDGKTVGARLSVLPVAGDERLDFICAQYTPC